MSDARAFGLKLAGLMLPGDYSSGGGSGVSGLSSAPPATDPTAFSRAIGSLSEPDKLTGALPQFDSSKGGVPFTPPKPWYQPAVDVYEWGKTPIGALQHAKQRGLTHLPYAEQEKAYWAAQKPPPESPTVAAIKEFGRVGGRDLWNFGSGTYNTVKNVGQGVSDAAQVASEIKAMLEKARQQSAPPVVSPEALEAARNAPKPTFMGTLGESIKNNPAWLLPAAGLGGLGAYGLYKLMSARRDAKKRRRLMSPAAVIN